MKIFGKGGPAKSVSSGSFVDKRSILPFLVPPASAFGMFALFLPIRLVLARDVYAFAWGGLILISYALINAASWSATKRAGKLTRVLVRAGFAAASVWSLAAAAAPHLSWRWYAVYTIASVVLTVASWVLIGLRDGDPQHGQYANVEGLKKVLDHVKAINATHGKDGRAHAQIEMKPGYALETLDTRAVAAVFDVPVGGAQARAFDDSSTRGTLILDPASRKAEAVPWNGPSVRPQGPGQWGSLVTDPIVIGPRSHFYLAGDASKGRNLSQILAVGMSGAGKTIFIQMTILEGLTRLGFEYDYADPRKANQAAPWVIAGARRVARTNREVAELLKDLRDEELPRRSAAMGAAHHEQWTEKTFTDLGIPLRLVVLDELAGVAQDLQRLLVDIAETARSLGVVLLNGFQRVTFDRMPTSYRAQLGTTVVFGVKDAAETEIACTEEMQEAGAQPELWQNKMPGMHYMEAPGDDGEPGTKRRTFAPNPALMAQWAEWLIATRRDEAGGGTAEVARQEAVQRPTRARQVVSRAVDPDELLDDDEDLSEFDEAADVDDLQGFEDFDDDLDGEDLTMEEEEELLDRLEQLGEEEGAALEADEDLAALQLTLPADLFDDAASPEALEPVDVSDASDEVLFEQRQRVPEDRAREILRDHVAAFARRGITEFRADSEVMEDVLITTGFGASWLRKWLDRLADEGELITKRGPRLGYAVTREITRV